MATVTEPIQAPSPPTAPSQPVQVVNRVVLHAVSWQEYTQFLEAVGTRRLRLTYDRGTLEIMTVSGLHEWWKDRVTFFIHLLGMMLRLDVQPYGHTTHRRQDRDRGLESDECFYIGNPAAVRGPRNIDLTRDPPPDLAVEIEISRSSLDRMGIYAALNIPEVWRFDGDTLRIYRLRGDGSYEETDRSLIFPSLPLSEFNQLLHQTTGLTAFDLFDRFQEWGRQHGLIGGQDTGNGSS